MSLPKNSSDNSQKPAEENSADEMKRRQQVTIGVLGIFQKNLPTTFESHPETSLSASAWLAGTSLFRSFGFKLDCAPGTVILSEVANQKGPILSNIFMYSLEKGGVKLKPGDVVYKFSEEHKPRKTILEIQEQFQDSYNEIMKKNGFEFEGAARMGAMVCAMMVNFHCISNHDLDPKLAVGLVLMGFVEGTKTCPVPLKW
jgi:hypothetical protein